MAYETQDYGTIKIPTQLIEKIDNHIKTSDEGYTSRTDVVKHAIRNFLRDHANKNYQPLESGEERTIQGGNEHEQMAERTSTQPDSKGLDNAQGKPHRANEKRVEDPKGKVESHGGEDDSL